jgi:hypothetical protein
MYCPCLLGLGLRKTYPSSLIAVRFVISSQAMACLLLTGKFWPSWRSLGRSGRKVD